MAPPRPSRRGPALPAVVGAAVGAAVAAALALAACSGGGGTPTTTTTIPPETTTSTTTPLEAGEQVDPYAPALGDCFDRRLVDDEEDGGQTPVTLLLDCSLPHRYEVFAVLTPPQAQPGADHPGDDVLRTFARAECVQAFEPYVGRPYVVSQLDIDWVLPTADGWAGGDRQVGCTLYDVGGGVVAGSAASSGR